MAGRKKSTDFESSMKRLETLVQQMEQGDLSIEEALKAFEEGISLTRECQAILENAEQKVRVLVESSSGFQTRPLNTDEPE